MYSQVWRHFILEELERNRKAYREQFREGAQGNDRQGIEVGSREGGGLRVKN